MVTLEEEYIFIQRPRGTKEFNDRIETFRSLFLFHYSYMYAFPLPGYAYDSDCIYINGTGEDEYEFYIQLNRCGTLGGSDHNKKRDVANYKNTEPTVRT